MTKRLALTPAVGLFAGLSVVSYGAVSMLLTGVHGTRQASTNPCASSATASPTATITTKALVRPAARTGARAQHPSGMPVLLADAVRLAPASKQGPAQAGTNRTAGSNQSTGQATASQSPPTLPSTQPSSSTSPPPLPQPSPGVSATPQPSGLPQPGPAKKAHSTPPLTPGGTLKSPTATATSTPTATRTPTPTPTATATKPPPGTLCIELQTLNNVSAVDPHTKIGYAIWVWLNSGTGGTAKITLSAKPSSVSPTFSVCSPSGKSKCTVGGLNAGQKVEVQAELAAPDRPAKHVTLTATATSSDASNSATASATVDIKPKNKPSPTSSPTPNAGDGGTLPPAAGLPSGTTIPGLGTSPTGDLGSAFPQVSPSPSAAGAAARHGHTTRTIDLSAGLPLTVRLIGGQVIGLAVLAAAMTIAVARLSLRRQPPRHGEDSAGS
jgi:hypothetical protein